MFWDNNKGQDSFSLALVTGSTSGIGFALCHLLASQGINLIIHGRNADKLEALSEKLSDKVKVQTIIADLTFPKEQMKVADLIATQKPDLVINNAGFGCYGKALEHTTDEQLAILEVDGQAVIRFSLEAARALIANGQQGVIMNISSVAGFMIFPNFALYSATKALVNQFSESFDEETKPSGVRVLAACPGVVSTNFRSNAGGNPKSKNNDISPMTADFAAKEIWNQIVK
ncbi:MAG: SDR family NAD(P)-dependent oxidoreductase, partial [Parachlamydiaceae bacterium]|nr:SDR family NAD(P)-dependent oxidoreductase [Parachlamydiaceae bacterium]